MNWLSSDALLYGILGDIDVHSMAGVEPMEENIQDNRYDCRPHMRQPFRRSCRRIKKTWLEVIRRDREAKTCTKRLCWLCYCVVNCGAKKRNAHWQPDKNQTETTNEYDNQQYARLLCSQL